MRRLLRLCGILLSTVPPAVAILEHFPLWLTRGKTAISAISLILLLLAAIPLLRILKARFKTPAPWLLWLILWLFLQVFLPIATALRTIALVSFPTCFLGAVCFRLAKRGCPSETGD